MKIRLNEYVEGGMADVEVSPGLIKNCLILGRKSKNNRVYTDAALKSAARLYEGAKVYPDHLETDRSGRPSRKRGVLEGLGRFKDVVVTPDGIRGNLLYNTEHPAARILEGWVRTDPTFVGFSHSADGVTRRNSDGIDEVTEILEVYSVDLVDSPATTRGLFEDVNVEEEPMLDTPPVEEPPVEEPPMDEPAPLPPPDDSGFVEQVGELVKSILIDSALDKNAKKKKILTALNLLDDSGPSGGEEMAESIANRVLQGIRPILNEHVEAARKGAKLTEDKKPVSRPAAKPVEKAPLTVEKLLEGVR